MAVAERIAERTNEYAPAAPVAEVEDAVFHVYDGGVVLNAKTERGREWIAAWAGDEYLVLFGSHVLLAEPVARCLYAGMEVAGLKLAIKL